jgi:hypothetical protein
MSIKTTTHERLVAAAINAIDTSDDQLVSKLEKAEAGS